MEGKFWKCKGECKDCLAWGVLSFFENSRMTIPVNLQTISLEIFACTKGCGNGSKGCGDGFKGCGDG